MKEAGLPFLPGVQTVSEAMALREQGFGLLKFFPADTAGGTAWLKAVAAPLAGLRFCPTGGIGIGDRAGLPGACRMSPASAGPGWRRATPWRRATGHGSSGLPPQRPRSNEPSAPAGKLLQEGRAGVRFSNMKKAVIAALALVLGASAVARADQVIVLNSEEASYSILSRGLRMEIQRLPLGREPHHLIADARRQGSC